jgi:membrane fusion protein (multidrug efflux system)
MLSRVEGGRVNSRNHAIRRSGLVTVIASLAILAGCGKHAGSDAQASEADQRPLLLSSEDLLTVRNNTLAQGPSITGSIQPERRADLRAEVSAIVLAVYKENGDPVKKGDLLVRLDDTAIRDSLTAAEASYQAAVQAYEQAQRQFERVSKLREQNLVSEQQLEDTEIRRNSAQSEREAARTRVVTARQQLQRTEVRAPFDGIVSDRKVSAGDTAQVGKELLKVIDPKSLRFEGLVSADSIGEVRAGQRVMFRIHGFADREFLGTIARVNPAANATTRQVEVLVNFADAEQQPEVAGLYAEGRIETRTKAALTLPPTAIVREGDATYAWAVKDGAIHKVSISLGERDIRTGEFLILSGISEGDLLLRHPNTTLHNGQAVEMASEPKPDSVLVTSSGK